MTEEHTRGIPYGISNKDIVEPPKYFGTMDNLNNLRKRLNELRDLGFNIYVNTRGLTKQVISLLSNYDLYYLFSDVYGAETIEEINQQTADSSITIEQYWAKRKVQNLDKICNREDVGKQCIYFIDDTILNIKIAYENGYVYSFVHDPKGTSSLVHKLLYLSKLVSVPELITEGLRIMILANYGIQKHLCLCHLDY